jgi:8-oxo-dGTP pyrophosphatase MutT (NUDIX family)
VEEGEAHEEALRRELLEEAGVEIEVLGRVGFVHLRHTTPKPRDHPFLYPDFLWPVYAARFAGWRHDARVEDGYELSSRFVPIPEARSLGLDGYETAFLDAAVAVGP